MGCQGLVEKVIRSLSEAWHPFVIDKRTTERRRVLTAARKTPIKASNNSEK